MAFAALGLRTELLSALESAGYTVPTPVQTQAIPVVLAGRDILAGAQTGTGKTAGFTLPLLQRLMPTSGKSPATMTRGKGMRYSARRPVRALILTPTRELAAQVEASVRLYGKFLPLVSAVIFGGVAIGPQMKALAHGVDILVATPGRLLDHVQQGTVDLSRIETFVLDEADRMLDMGFINDIRKIVALLPMERQTLLFSATFSDEIKRLADGLLNDPVHVEVARQSAESELVNHIVYSVTTERKRELLFHLLRHEKIDQALIFTRTKHNADRLAKQLSLNGFTATVIHGNRSQSQRMNALAEFKGGRAPILVATDIAARGLDIRELPYVINYELPNIPEDYVHRIGRTGRAGRSGEAISLVSQDERKFLLAIEKLLKKPVERRTVDGFEAAPLDAPAVAGRTFSSGRDSRNPQRGGPRRFGRPGGPGGPSSNRPRSTHSG